MILETVLWSALLSCSWSELGRWMSLLPAAPNFHLFAICCPSCLHGLLSLPMLPTTGWVQFINNYAFLILLNLDKGLLDKQIFLAAEFCDSFLMLKIFALSHEILKRLTACCCISVLCCSWVTLSQTCHSYKSLVASLCVRVRLIFMKKKQLNLL